MATEKSLLTPEGVCLILEAAIHAKVTLLKFGDLHVEFGPRAPSTVLRGTLAGENSGPPPAPTAEMVEIQKTEQTRAILQEEVRSREQQLEQMIIEDPAAAERLLTEGDLITDDEPDDESDDA